jgi:glycopeptide antibiotics resistance protein
MSEQPTSSRRHPVVVPLALLYALAVIAVTVVPVRVHHRWAPWWSVIEWVPFQVPPLSFLLNIVMFLPFGVLVPLLWPRTGSMRRLAAWALGASVAIELTQLLLWITLGARRTVDVNDLIANVAGGVLGFVVLRTVTTRRAAYDAFQARM